MSKHRTGRAGFLLAAALCTPCAFAAPIIAPSLAACDAPAVATVLAPAAAIDARAYWLDRRRIQWPEVEAGAAFKLYYSRRGGIVAREGAALRAPTDR